MVSYENLAEFNHHVDVGLFWVELFRKMWYFLSSDILYMSERRYCFAHEPWFTLKQISEEIIRRSDALANQATNFKLIWVEIDTIKIHISEYELMKFLIQRVEKASKL